MKILVTGGAGFIGSHIAETLLQQGNSVVLLDNFSTGKVENIAPFKSNIKLIKGDIRNDSVLNRALKGVKYVIHQAALRSVQRSVDNPVDTNGVNVTGTLRLLLASKRNKIKRLVYASSSSVYGESEIFPQKETHTPKPLSPYAVSKLSGEYYCRVFAKTFGLETVSLRYFNVIGPRHSPKSKYALVVPLFIYNAMRNNVIEIHGTGLQSRDFTYVSNVVQANISALKAKKVSGEAFNIACGQTHSVLDIVKVIEQLAGKKLKIRHVGARAGDVNKTYASIDKAKKLLGYKPKVKFEEGIRRTWNYFAPRRCV